MYTPFLLCIHYKVTNANYMLVEVINITNVNKWTVKTDLLWYHLKVLSFDCSSQKTAPLSGSNIATLGATIALLTA